MNYYVEMNEQGKPIAIHSRKPDEIPTVEITENQLEYFKGQMKP